MLSGINIEATVKLAQALLIPVIASGGLSSLDDIRQLCARRRGRHQRRDRRPRHLRWLARFCLGAGGSRPMQRGHDPRHRAANSRRG
jgi:hypothetical protein